MTAVNFEPLSVAVPLWEDPPGVFRVGKSRVLLELVLHAFQHGESPEGIVRSYRALQLADVYAVIGRYLADPAPFDDYLRRCELQAEEVPRQDRGRATRRGQQGRIARPSQGQGADPVIAFLVDQNFNEHIVDGLTRRDAALTFSHVRRGWPGGSARPDRPGMGCHAAIGPADTRWQDDSAIRIRPRRGWTGNVGRFSGR